MKLLVLEDSRSTQLLMKRRLEKEGHLVDAVGNGHQGFQLATRNSYDAVISDIMMPNWDGFKFLEAVQVVNPHLPIIIVSSAENDEEVTTRLERYRNIAALLPKPLEFDKLFSLLGTIQVQSQFGISKKARIVCTIGPASSDAGVLGQMIIAGMDVARLNFSHGTHELHGETLWAVRQAEEHWGKPVAILQDLCGPKIRAAEMQSGGVRLENGRSVIIQKDPIIGTSERFSTIAPEIIDDLRPGDPVLLDDGLLELKVVECYADEVVCQVIAGGVLKTGKGINLPATKLSLPSVTEKDWRDLDWALENQVDYVALSFVRTADEIAEIKQYIRAKGKGQPRVVAKIEKPEAVNNIREIIAVSDAVMVARGDMGVELPAARVPRIQQEIVRLCRQMNTPVIIATQMLDSMTTNVRPTRAEVTDVSTAIRSGADAVMLSQETAVGVDPVNVVRTMASIIYEEEQYVSRGNDQETIDSTEDSNPIIAAVARIPELSATLLLDPEGDIYPVLSKSSRQIPSILVTRSRQAARHACLYKNITPLILSEQMRRNGAVFKSMEMAVSDGLLRANDLICVLEGARHTNTGFEQQGALQLVRVPDTSSD